MEKSSASQRFPEINTSGNVVPSDAQLNRNLVTMNMFQRYIMWENTSNVCWLDSSMALLVHNISLMRRLKDFNDGKSQVFNIARLYHTAHCNLNANSGDISEEEKTTSAKRCLKDAQEQVLKYLQPILKFKRGEPDSAFCSLLNLINETETVKNIFELEYSWSKVCGKCHRREDPTALKKCIVTIHNLKSFQAQAPVALFKCPGCHAVDQEMSLRYQTLPQCLLFHFESGAGKGTVQDSLQENFQVEHRQYRLTGLIVLLSGEGATVSHFVTFIRDPVTDKWLQRNDLDSHLRCFGKKKPKLALSDVCFVAFEANDARGAVQCQLMAADRSFSKSVGIPLIDLEDDDAPEGQGPEEQTPAGRTTSPIIIKLAVAPQDAEV